MSDAEQATDAPTTTTPALWAERVGTRTFLARNARGAEVLIGPVELDGAFTPGELLALALAACSGMSADHRIAHHLGPDYHGVLSVERTSVPGENRYSDFDIDIAADFSGVGPEDRRRMEDRATRAVQRGCTVGRTLQAGAEYVLTFTDRSDR